MPNSPLILILYSEICDHSWNEMVSDFLPRFSVEYQNKINKYRLLEDKMLTLTGRKLLKHGLSLLGISADIFNLKYYPSGKPFLNSDGVTFNISHSKEIVCCALSRDLNVGIDIEYAAERDIETFKTVFSNAEWVTINAAGNRQRAFYGVWTKKEAVLKAQGQGLNLPMAAVELSEGCAVVKNCRFSVTEVQLVANYVCHLAYDCFNVPIEVIKI